VQGISVILNFDSCVFHEVQNKQFEVMVEKKTKNEMVSVLAFVLMF
jgi:hypothetical protein